MAGNIIPAIATTNAIVAGMIVMLALKVILGKTNECKHTFVAYGGDRVHFLMNEIAPKANPNCMVCTNGYLTLQINLKDPLMVLISALQNPKQFGVNVPGELTIQDGDRYK